MYEIIELLKKDITDCMVNDGNCIDNTDDVTYALATLETLIEAINYTRSCTQLKHDDLEIGKQVEIDLTFTEKHKGKIVSIGKDKVTVENNDWTYEVGKENITKVF